MSGRWIHSAGPLTPPTNHATPAANASVACHRDRPAETTPTARNAAPARASNHLVAGSAGPAANSPAATTTPASTVSQIRTVPTSSDDRIERRPGQLVLRKETGHRAGRNAPSQVSDRSARYEHHGGRRGKGRQPY